MGEYEGIKKFDWINSTKCASYMEHNPWVVDDSDTVIFILMSKNCDRDDTCLLGGKIKNKRGENRYTKCILRIM